jgi:hypothetical protein
MGLHERLIAELEAENRERVFPDLHRSPSPFGEGTVKVNLCH